MELTAVALTHWLNRTHNLPSTDTELRNYYLRSIMEVFAAKKTIIIITIILLSPNLKRWVLDGLFAIVICYLFPSRRKHHYNISLAQAHSFVPFLLVFVSKAGKPDFQSKGKWFDFFHLALFQRWTISNQHRCNSSRSIRQTQAQTYNFRSLFFVWLFMFESRTMLAFHTDKLLVRFNLILVFK